MPTYTYRCPKCDTIKPVTQKPAESPYIRCVHCSTLMVRGIRQQTTIRNLKV
jgi:putative FmdB family regulatory protein